MSVWSRCVKKIKFKYTRSFQGALAVKAVSPNRVVVYMGNRLYVARLEVRWLCQRLTVYVVDSPRRALVYVLWPWTPPTTSADVFMSLMFSCWLNSQDQRDLLSAVSTVTCDKI